MLRDIIEIDEELCVGCGNCVPNCHQGALQIIDGKARLISDLMCEGIGVCVGHCPTGAMKIEKREAEPYDEHRVMEKICAGGPNVIQAHLEHLRRHGQTRYLNQAIEYLEQHNMEVPEMDNPETVPEAARTADAQHAHGQHAQRQQVHGPRPHAGGGCPGSMARSFGSPAAGEGGAAAAGPAAGSNGGTAQAEASELRQWPIQLHLLNPAAEYFQNADVLLAADCTAFAMGMFHQRLLRGKTLAIACPKLDQGLANYVEKITAMIDDANINTLTVVMMEVPCCGGLLQIAQAAVEQAERKIPIKQMIVTLRGEIRHESWVL